MPVSVTRGRKKETDWKHIMKKLVRLLVLGLVLSLSFMLFSCEKKATVTVSDPSVTVEAGEVVTVTASADVLGDITWSSSDEAIAKVNGGAISGVAAGTATITASLGKASATIAVTVTPRITYTITLDKTVLALKTTLKQQLTATVSPAGTSVSWSSSNAAVATVAADGMVSAIAEGSATITAKAGRASADCLVTVTAKARAVFISPLDGADDYVIAGKSYQLTASVMPSNATQTVIWSVSADSASYASVSADGLVTSLALTDEVTIIATSSEDATVSAEYALTVQAPAPESIEIAGAAADVDKYQTLVLSATVLPAFSSQAIIWSSTDPLIGSISSEGLFTAVAEGEVTITATSKIDKNVKTSVTITIAAPKPTKLDITTDETTLLAGETAQIKATVLPADAAQGVKFVSSASSIVSVSDEGLVTANAIGTATVTITSSANNSLTSTVTFTVTTAPAAPAHHDIVVDASYAGERFSSTTYTINGKTEDFILGVNLFKDFGEKADALVADGSVIYVGAGEYLGSLTIAHSNVSILTANAGKETGRGAEAVFGGTLAITASITKLVINGLSFGGDAQVKKDATVSLNGFALIYCASTSITGTTDFLSFPSAGVASQNFKIMYNSFKGVDLSQSGAFMSIGNLTGLVVTHNTFVSVMSGSKATVTYWFYLGGTDALGMPGAEGVGLNGTFEFAQNTVTNATRSAVKVVHYAGGAKTDIAINTNTLDGTIWNFVTSAAFEITGYAGSNVVSIDVSYNKITDCFRGINIDTANVTDATKWTATANYNDFDFDGFQSGYVSNRIWSSKTEAVAGFSDTILVNADYNFYHNASTVDDAVAIGTRLYGVEASAVTTKYASATDIPASTIVATSDTTL